MHTDSETTDISLLGFMHYMIAASLEMSDEPFIEPTINFFSSFRYNF